MKLLILILLLSPAAFAKGGASFRGGGDELALEFSEAFKAAVDEIHLHYPDLAGQVDAIPNLTEPVKVFIVDEPLLVDIDGGRQECVAMNERDSRSVWINRVRWKKIRNSRLRQAIALHEVLSLSRAETTGHYPISAAYLAKYHLRNDAVVFVTGRDPDLPEWKTRRKICDFNYAWTNSKTGKLERTISTALKAELNWDLGGRFYVMDYTFGPNRKPGDVISMFQMKARVVWARGNQTLMEGSGMRALGKSDGDALKREKSAPVQILVEDLGSGKAENWSWVNGGKGKLQYTSISSELADGSIRTISEYVSGIRPGAEPDREDCVTTDLPGEQWLALVGDVEMGMEIEKLNAVAMIYYDSERKLKDCESGNCMAQKTNRETALAKFNSAWDSLFSSRYQRLRKSKKVRPFGSGA